MFLFYQQIFLAIIFAIFILLINDIMEGRLPTAYFYEYYLFILIFTII